MPTCPRCGAENTDDRASCWSCWSLLIVPAGKAGAKAAAKAAKMAPVKAKGKKTPEVELQDPFELAASAPAAPSIPLDIPDDTSEAAVAMPEPADYAAEPAAIAEEPVVAEAAVVGKGKPGKAAKVKAPKPPKPPKAEGSAGLFGLFKKKPAADPALMQSEESESERSLPDSAVPLDAIPEDLPPAMSGVTAAPSIPDDDSIGSVSVADDAMWENVENGELVKPVDPEDATPSAKPLDEEEPVSGVAPPFEQPSAEDDASMPEGEYTVAEPVTAVTKRGGKGMLGLVVVLVLVVLSAILAVVWYLTMGQNTSGLPFIGTLTHQQSTAPVQGGGAVEETANEYLMALATGNTGQQASLATEASKTKRFPSWLTVTGGTVAGPVQESGATATILINLQLSPAPPQATPLAPDVTNAVKRSYQIKLSLQKNLQRWQVDQQQLLVTLQQEVTAKNPQVKFPAW
ncbi:MAG: hypothetical protein ACYDBB_05495 [Armatimonadota bacterium]